MPPANVKHTFMKCKICAKLIDHMDLTSHANMHRQQGDIGSADGSNTASSTAPFDSTSAPQQDAVEPVTSAEPVVDSSKLAQRTATPQQKTIQKQSVQQKTVQQQSVQQKTVQQQSVQQKTVQQQSVQQKTVPQQSVRQKTVQQQSVQQKTVSPRAVPPPSAPQEVTQKSKMVSPTAGSKSPPLIKVSHLFVTEKVSGINKDTQLFTCELCVTNTGLMDFDTYSIHLTQPQHMKNVFIWLFEAKADTIYKYKVLVTKLQASKKTEGLFCEFCRKASFNVKDMNSHQSHLSSSKHMDIVKSLRTSYNQVRARISAPNKRKSTDNSPATDKDKTPNKKPKLDSRLSTDVEHSKSISKSSRVSTTSHSSTSRHSRSLRRSPSWSPLRNSTPSPQGSFGIGVQVITLDAVGDTAEIDSELAHRPMSALLSPSSRPKHNKDSHRNHSRSSPTRSSRRSHSPSFRARSPRSRLRSGSSGRRKHRSRSPRYRRSRSKQRSRRSRSYSRERKSSYHRSQRLSSPSRSGKHSPSPREHRNSFRRRRSRSWSSRSPGRQKSYRSRSPDSVSHSLTRSPDRSFMRHDGRSRGRSPVHPVVQRPELQKRRLRPRPLSPWSIDSLTFLVEKKWTNYYEKYYCTGVRDDNQCLDMQKQYLQAYKGFFVEDPNFDLCYTQLLKPEALRTLLTERIDRGSPGPSTVEQPADLPVMDFDTIEPGELVDDERRRELRKRKWERRLGNKEAATAAAAHSSMPSYDVDSRYSSRDMPSSSNHREQGLLSNTVHPAPVLPPNISPSQAAASFHSFDKLKALIRESLKIPTGDKPKAAKPVINSSIEVPDLVKQALHQINTSSAREMEPEGPPAPPRPSSTQELIFQDPFLGFVHNVLSGILKMTGLQDEVDSGSAPAGARSQLYHEQRRMHESMVTPEGHLLIRMARMTLTNVQRLDSKFGASHVDVVAILKNLDRDVLQLIADTPMLKQ